MTPIEIKAWRKSLHHTQAAASSALGISIRRYQAYEAGEINIPVSIEYACRWLARNAGIVPCGSCANMAPSGQAGRWICQGCSHYWPDRYEPI